MTCPQCQLPLSHLNIEDVSGNPKVIEECLSCGGHFLENYLVNFISVETGRNIDSVIPKNPHVTLANPQCHKCGQAMFSISDDAVPKTVTVYQCPNNHGDFFPKGQLYLFKKAQQAKINYHKLWGIPLKTAFSVIIPVFVVFSAVTILPRVMTQLNTTQENRVKASEILTPPLTTPISDTQVLISFSTVRKVKTSLEFTKGLNKSIVVSNIEDTNHLISLEDLPPMTDFSYYIIIETADQKIKTSEYGFSTP